MESVPVEAGSQGPVRSGAPTEARHAYALVEDPLRPGRYFSVHLTGVIADSAEIIEPSACSEYALNGVNRIINEIHRRTRKQLWK